MIPNRPRITDPEVDKIVAAKIKKPGPVLLIGVRGYFLNTIGRYGQNDFNVYDDAMLVVEEGELLKTFNANTDPSKRGANLAMLDPGLYTFYRGVHKNRIKAFRAHPEGVSWPCTRDGKKSKCSLINIHDGGLNDTWSAGCQTIPNTGKYQQFNEFRDLVYRLMDKHEMDTIQYLLIEEQEMRSILSK